jgi:nitroreductase/NAD-dependent dihydropyrimidine dehydrogenase PreA subunit
MSLLTVNPETCNRDGICTAVCPAGIIQLDSSDELPVMIDGGEAFCIRCGHCVAVCPQAAMSHAAMNSTDCPPLRREWLLDAEHLEHFLRSRRSIRNYKRKTVAREVLAKLIDVAHYAPSGHNLQPVEWRVIHDRSEVFRLSGLVIDWMRNLIAEQSPLVATLHLNRVVSSWEAGVERICRGAPHVVVAHAPAEERTAATACTIALTYLELAAPAFGLGACWAGYFNAAANFWPPMTEALELPAGHASFGAMMLGYPRYQFHRLTLRKPAVITWK